MALTERANVNQVFLFYRGKDGRWEIDGGHAEDADLLPTIAILRRLGYRGRMLKLTLREREHYGDMWPTLEDFDG